jgi:hypothetical protein
MDIQENLSGCVAHGHEPTSAVVSSYGTAPSECELLDGLLIVAYQHRLKERAVFLTPASIFASIIWIFVEPQDRKVCASVPGRSLSPIKVTDQSTMPGRETIAAIWTNGAASFSQPSDTFS